MEFLLVLFFPHLDQKKLCIWTLFTQLEYSKGVIWKCYYESFGKSFGRILGQNTPFHAVNEKIFFIFYLHLLSKNVCYFNFPSQIAGHLFTISETLHKIFFQLNSKFDSFRTSRLQKFFKISVLKRIINFTGIQMCVLESLYNMVAGLKALQHSCFPAKLTKFFRKTFFTEYLRWLLLLLPNQINTTETAFKVFCIL